MKSLFHGTGSVPLDVKHLPLLHGPTVWNTLPEDMRDPDVSEKLQAVTDFRSTSVFNALEVFYENALYKFTFDIDI